MLEWHYRMGRAQFGPISREDLQKLLDSGELQADTLVWREGTPDWRPARELFPAEHSGSSIAEGAPPAESVPAAEPLDRPRPPDRDPEVALNPPYPGKLRTAGIIWVVIGGLVLLGNAVNIIVTVTTPGQRPALAGLVCSGVVAALFGAAFLFVGVQSIDGSAPGTMGNGIGSIIFAALVIGGGIVSVVAAGALWPMLIAGAEAAALFIAGILAMVSGPEYAEWRSTRKARQRRGAETGRY
ncbi:MAG: DUF4339 domain-containing protein [Gemmataceae bacterium]